MDDRNDPVIAEYSRLATTYDCHWADYVDTTTRATLDRLALQSGERILDVGCGTGVLLERILATGNETAVAGVDPVREMLAVARQRLPMEVPLYVGRGECLPFADASFDVVVSTSAFHYMRDPEYALVEMHRVLAPGGRLLISDWCADYMTCRVLDLYLRMTDQAHHRTWRGDELLRLVTRAGFVGSRVDRYRTDWRWGMMSVHGRRQPGSAHE